MSGSKALFLVGRILFGGFFLFSGTHHFSQLQSLAGYTAAKGLPFPELAVVVSGALLVLGGLSVLLGLRPKLGLLAIVLFLVPVTLVMHDFWNVTNPEQRALEMGNFLKNAALCGGALALWQVPEPWPISLGEGAPFRLSWPPRRRSAS